MELPLSLLRTLSAIAIKQPVAQSQIIKIRGVGAYDHIKELIERELIIKREDGRSPLLTTTKKFQEYFRLSHDAKSLRDELQEQMPEAVDGADASTFTADPLAVEVGGEEEAAAIALPPIPSGVADPEQFEPPGTVSEAVVNSEEIRA
jgi:hypothetical protein